MQSDLSDLGSIFWIVPKEHTLTCFLIIVCSKCDKLRVGNCPVHGSLTWVKEPSVVLVKEGLTKARSTLPSNMDLKTSSIPGKRSYFTFNGGLDTADNWISVDIH